MENPWRELKRERESRYVLIRDSADIDGYNNNPKRNDDTRIDLKSVPEPFIGNPASAKVVLLSLNPGHSEDDSEAHSKPHFNDVLFHNLHHELQDYPFYPLNPEFSGTGAAKWWRPRTRELRERVSNDRALAERLLVIEWFPYHSRKSNSCVCESQCYSFQLAKKMLDEKKLVVGMRARKKWIEADPRFEQIPFLKNPQCGYISRGNTGEDLFERIVEALKRCGCPRG